MNGVHDMGGMQGLGPIAPEPNEPLFHEPWEARALALTLAAPLQLLQHIVGTRRHLETGHQLATEHFHFALVQDMLVVVDGNHAKRFQSLDTGRKYAAARQE